MYGNFSYYQFPCVMYGDFSRYHSLYDFVVRTQIVLQALWESPILGTENIDGFNYRVWHYKNYHVIKTGSHFVGKRKPD